MDIAAWLSGLGLERYLPAFEEHAVEADVLPYLTAEDLKDLGVEQVGHRRRLLQAIALLSAPSQPETVPQPASAPALPSFSDASPGPAEAERRTLTVLFCDMVGSTEIAAASDPEDYRAVMTAFHRAATEAIRRFGGHVSQFLGDGLLAYFGYPQTEENEAERALRAGLAVIAAAAHILTPSGRPLAVRAGAATGLVVVGKLLGEEGNRESAAVGEIPNLAARFQQLGRPGELICGGVTRRLAGGLFDFEALAPADIKGFSEPIPAFRVVGERVIESRFAATRAAASGLMVGRAQERALLLDRWAIAKEGEGQIVLIAGEPGIGKSCLVQELLVAIAEEPHYRIAFQCSPHYKDSALLPAIRQLEASAGFQVADGLLERRQKLRALLSEVPGTDVFAEGLEALLSLQAEGRSSDEAPERTRRQILQALVGRLEVAQLSRPLLCILEDAHWIDPSTLEMITLLTERMASQRMLIVVTYRAEFDCPWTRLPYATLLKLNRLSRSQSVTLIRSLQGERRLPEAVVEEILEKVDGVPLFIEEVVKSLLDQGPLEAESDEAAAFAPRPRVSVPETLHDTLLSRLDRDELAKQVAQVASVIGRDFGYALLAALGVMPEERLAAGLRSLVESAIVVRQPNAREAWYSFRHGLFHEATYSTLLVRRRQELHRRVAETLERIFPDAVQQRPELLARHLDSAGLTHRAAEAWLKAGRHALGQGAYGEAMQHLRAGLLSVQQMPQTPLSYGLELPLQMALAETFRSARFTGGDEPLLACRRARELAERLADLPNFVRVLRLELGMTFNRPDLAGVARIGEEFMTIAEERGQPIARVLGEQSLGLLAFVRGDLQRARERLLRAIEAAEQVEDPRALAELQFPTTALSYLSYGELLMGRPAAARAIAERSLESYGGASKFGRSLALANYLIYLRLAGDDLAARNHLAELKGLAEARGAPYWMNLVLLHESLSALDAGQVEEGHGGVRRAIETFVASAVEIEIPFYLMLLADRLLANDRADLARPALAEALARAEASGERWCFPELLRLRAQAMAGEDPASAEADLKQAIAAARAQGALLWELRAATSLARLATGRASRQAALESLRQAVARCEGDGGPLADLSDARSTLAAGTSSSVA